MLAPADHPRETERLALLERCQVLDTSAEPEFDGIVELAASIAGTPITLISLVDRHRQWFKARRGVSVAEAPRTISFCGHAILNAAEPLVVEDATRDPRFLDNPFVTGEPPVVFYAGVPLRVGPDRLPIGTLCAIGHEPQTLEPSKLKKLQLLARQAEMLFELRLRQQELEDRLLESRRNEEYVQALVSAMDGGLVVHDASGAIVSCNPGAERILGLTADQLMGRSSFDPHWCATRADGSSFPGDEHPAMVALRTGRPVRDVVMGVGVSDRERRWILVNAQPTQVGPDGRPGRVLASFSDITALRREEAERRRAEEAVERFFTLSLDLLCIASSEGRFLRLNPAWTTMLGWSIDELLARPFIDLVHPEDRERTIREAARLGRGATSVGFENRYSCKDGSWRVLSWVSAGVAETGMVIAVARDVTQERAREAELRRTKEAAEASKRAADEFLATMSHEIRTPMNGVIGLTEVLLGTSLDAEQRDMLRSIQDSGNALLDILNAILDWSRIEAGRLELEKVPVDVIRLARDVVTVLAPQATAKGLRLDLEIAPELTHDVLGDAGRIRQVLFNLVGNAVKFTPSGRVLVRLTRADRPGGWCRIDVIDTGIGISQRDLERLFQRFTQVDASTTRRFGGSGLGLAISRELCRSMGGVITVESELGRGSTFTVELPVAESRTQPSPQPQVAKPKTSARRLRVLLAEDNPVNQRVASALLMRDGHEVEVASNGRAALECFVLGGWDLVLMDVQMPDMDGLEATRAMRKAERESGGRRVPIIALTASAMPEERNACLEAGMDDVLAKPLTVGGLRQVLLNVA